MAAAADVVGATPVAELVGGRGGEQHLARGRAGQGVPGAAERVGVVRAAQDAGVAHGVDRLELAVQAPAAAAGVGDLGTGGEAQLAALAGEHGHRPVARVLAPHHEVDAGNRAGAAEDLAPERAAGPEQVDHRRPLGRAQGDLGLLRPGVGRPDHGEVGELVGQGDRPLDGAVGVVGDDDHGVRREKGVEPAAGVDHPSELVVGRGDRVDLGVRAVLVGVGVVVGQREQEEVEEVVLDEVDGDAAGVLVADAGHAELAAAVGLAAGEDVGVEQLARAHHRMTHEHAGGKSGQGRLERRLVDEAAAVDQVGRAGGADLGVVERLEDRRDIGGEMGAVHVVDQVRQLPGETGLPGRAQARAVLDVPALAAVVPVHRGNQMPVLGDAGGDRRGADGGHRGEDGDGVADVGAAGDQLGDDRGAAVGDGAVDHRRLGAVDHGQHELPGRHLRMRSPAYFSPARRRAANRSRAKNASATNPTGGTKTARAASTKETPST